MLQDRFRERRGIVQLLGVPPPVGFALMKHFANPNRALNRDMPKYTPAHPSWKQGASTGGKFMFQKFAYDDMMDTEWAFPLHQFYRKTCQGPVRLAKGTMWQDPRLLGTPTQFKYKWQVQKELGVPTPGVHTFTISFNITHMGQEPTSAPRYNIAYERWVPELQLFHLSAIQKAVAAFPARPLSSKHPLFNAVHPLAHWQPAMPVAAVDRRELGEDANAFADTDDDDDDDDDMGDDWHAVSDDNAGSSGGSSDECPCVGCDPSGSQNS